MSSVLSSPLGEAVLVGLAVTVAAAVIVVAAVAVASLVVTVAISATGLMIGGAVCVALGVLAGVCYATFNTGTTGGTSTGATVTAIDEASDLKLPEQAINKPESPSQDDSRRSRWILRFLPLENGEKGVQPNQCNILIQTEGIQDSKSFKIDEKSTVNFYQAIETHLKQWLDEQESHNKNGTLEVFLVREPNPGKSVLQHIERSISLEKKKRGVRLSIGVVSTTSQRLSP